MHGGRINRPLYGPRQAANDCRGALAGEDAPAVGTAQLQLRPGTPVMVIVRTTYYEDTPFETADLLLDAHRFELEYALKVDPSR